ncbi:MAG: hypothetical protein KGJ78_15565 [Alphaproteobacteria bacterium]|nr:hypothetical protein [Alphaproteobacteria bacterium]
MYWRLHIVIASAMLTASLLAPAWAEGGTTKLGGPGTNVEMPFLIAPMNKDGKLLGYAYISSKLVASSPSAAITVRNKLAFIQDAFVRDVNAEPIAQISNPQLADTELLASRLVADARRFVGDGTVVGIVFTQIQFAPLHSGDSTLNQAPPNQVTSSKAPLSPQAASTAARAGDGNPQVASSKTAAPTTH